MADETATTTPAAAPAAAPAEKPANSATEFAQSDSSKATSAENNAPADNTTPERSTDGIQSDTSAVGGQNHPAAVPTDERDSKEQGEALAREEEAKILDPEHGAGDSYLYPSLPVSAQNPPKEAIIAYKHDPTGPANNS